MQSVGLIAVQDSGVKARGRPDHWVLFGNLQVAGRIRERLADGNDGSHSRLPRTGQNFTQVAVKIRAAEVGMRVDQEREG
jgi:hypothetical protein